MICSSSSRLIFWRSIVYIAAAAAAAVAAAATATATAAAVAAAAATATAAAAAATATAAAAAATAADAANAAAAVVGAFYSLKKETDWLKKQSDEMLRSSFSSLHGRHRKLLLRYSKRIAFSPETCTVKCGPWQPSHHRNGFSGGQIILYHQNLVPDVKITLRLINMSFRTCPYAANDIFVNLRRNKEEKEA